MFAALANAQSPGDANNNRERAVVRVNTDLAGLKAFPARDLAVRSQCMIRRDRSSARPAECEPVDRLADDLSLVEGNPPHFPTQVLAINLAGVLSGHELEPDALSLLAGSLVNLVAIADRSAEVRTPVSESRAFRDSLLRAYAALVALGIREVRAEVFLRILARSAENRSRPPELEPIPPALR